MAMDHASFLKLLDAEQIGQTRNFQKGQIIYWQGDPVDHIYILKSGAVKIYSLSSDGRVYIFGFGGPGELLCASDYLLGKPTDTIAEAAEDSRMVVLTPAEFEQQLGKNATFSAYVIKKLAQWTDRMANRVRAMSFLDVQQRLKQSLIELANEHGIVTQEGIRIDLDITHEDIGELVAANRTTITTFLNEFKRQGYLWKDGHHLVIIPLDHMEILDQISQAVVEGDENAVSEWTQRAIQKGVDPLKAFDALASGMRQVDRMLVSDEIEIADVILAAYVMKAGLTILEGPLQQSGGKPDHLGKIVIGTVYGDIHDIGRMMVAMMLTARGFEVIDLGVNVSTVEFVDAVRAHRPDILAMSSLMTSTTHEQSKVIEALKQENLYPGTLVIVGGGAVTSKYSQEIGASGYAPSAQSAVDLAWRLIRESLQRKARPPQDSSPNCRPDDNFPDPHSVH